ncbi:hypothetical protein OG196_43175 (plasmid) [Kitasatospora purpeofusca]|uniref:hypothetical protein n=1 Tax=Kitasatospora purpeofusca TaxID=67352 RepID=UPI002E0F6F69|nr:hypothetical protein OG196_43175 [Kitasatospora purpeofusca]
MIDNRVFADILIEGMDDWVPIDQLIWAAKEEVGRGLWKNYFAELLVFLVENDLIQIGELTEGGFSPWIGEPARILQLVTEDLESLSWDPRLGSRAWISNTGTGNDLARTLITP